MPFCLQNKDKRVLSEALLAGGSKIELAKDLKLAGLQTAFVYLDSQDSNDIFWKFLRRQR